MVRGLYAGFGLLLAAVVLTSNSKAAAPPSATSASRNPSQLAGAAKASVPIKGFVDTYCIACHNDRLKTADLVLENRDLTAIGKDAAIWEKVVTKLHAGAMPPPTSRRPDAATYQAFIATLEDALDRAATAPNPGRPPIHRLNRLEYTNAIRDLLGLEIDGKTMLPADDSGFGFDNIADVLSVSPGLLERYLLAANKISRLVVGDPALVPGVTVYEVSDRTTAQDDRMSEELPFGSRGGAAIKHYFPLDGEYSLKFIVQRADLAANDAIRGLDVANMIDIRLDRARLKVVTIGGPGDKPTFGAVANYYAEQFAPDEKAEFRFHATAGTHTIGISLNRDVWNIEGVGVRRLSLTSEAYNRASTTSPTDGRIEMQIRKVEIGGPFDGKVPVDSPARRRVYVCRPMSAADETSCATRILSTLARRAYRRPVTNDEVKTLMAFYSKGREAGASFDTGIQAALARILVDVNFLFRLEKDPPGLASNTPYGLSDLDLASRLSFFLWSSIPDDELLDLAARNALHQPAVLEREVKRMLADPRSNVMISNFSDQWLYLRNMATVRPDPARFPAFDENLRTAFQEETRLFLQNQIREDRPLSELLTANYTFVNERLARHYGIANVSGSHFRRVTLPDGTRAGLLGQGSVLTVTSYADRTSVVQRGKWIMDHLLGVPPPPPPPNVPPLDDTKIEGSLRQRMETHRRNPVCATCHNQIDPLGFALENFDAIGQFRSVDGTTPIDATGKLVDGTAFDGPAALRTALLTREGAFRNTLTTKLLTYAMGRGVENFDMPAVRQILRDAKASDYRWSAVIVGIVKSQPFQMRRAES